jgi:hypothetical protein
MSRWAPTTEEYSIAALDFLFEVNGLCHGTGAWQPPPHRTDPTSIPSQYMWDLWWVECTATFFLHVLRFYSTSAPYSFTDLTPMLMYKCTYILIKRQRRYINHVTVWRLTCHANSFSCHRFVINALYCFYKDNKRHDAVLQSESIAELFSLRPAPRAMTSRITCPCFSKGMTKPADVRVWSVCSVTVPIIDARTPAKTLKIRLF